MTRLSVGAALMGTAMLASSMPLPVEMQIMPRAIYWRSPIEEQIAQRVKKISPRADADEIASAIVDASKYYGIDPLLVATVVEIESAYNHKAIGKVGERGLMQIKRETAKDLGLKWVNAFDIRQNVMAGASYLARHLADYADVSAATARYNGAGPKARSYARKVSMRYSQIAKVDL